MGGKVGWGVVEDIEVRFGWDLDLGMSVSGLCLCMLVFVCILYRMFDSLH
jgi:hypothetical protein